MTMRKCKVHFENIPGSPYSPSAQHDAPKLDRESHDDYDERTWREHCTTNKAGQVVIPAMAFKQGIDQAAQKLGEKVPGRRGATFKSFFASGYFCNEDVPISNGNALSKADAEKIKINANADGMRGSGKRVKRRFPQFEKYHGVVEFTIVDDIITKEIFEHHFKSFGMIVGIGRFRVGNGGRNGRIKATKFEWEDVQLS
jgi:hypothetical protein